MNEMDGDVAVAFKGVEWHAHGDMLVPEYGECPSGCGAERGGLYGFSHQEVSYAFLSEGQHPR